jgi:hypothetical protein
MYCQVCGAPLAEGLVRYCPRCGAAPERESDRAGDAAGLSPDGLVWALVVVTLGVTGIAIGLMAVMKTKIGVSTEIIVALTSLLFLILLAIDSTFLWLLLRRSGRPEAAHPPRTFTTAGLDAAQPRKLPEPPVSVTEHTTRTLEPARAGEEHD